MFRYIIMRWIFRFLLLQTRHNLWVSLLETFLYSLYGPKVQNSIIRFFEDEYKILALVSLLEFSRKKLERDVSSHRYAAIQDKEKS